MAYTPYDPTAHSDEIVEAILNRAEEFSRGYRLGQLEKENEILKEVNKELRSELDKAIDVICKWSGTPLPRRTTSIKPDVNAADAFSKFLKFKEDKND